MPVLLILATFIMLSKHALVLQTTQIDMSSAPRDIEWGRSMRFAEHACEE